MSATADTIVPQILSMKVESGVGQYRLRIGDRAKYLMVVPGTFDTDRLFSLPIASLPPLPCLDGDDWDTTILCRDLDSGELIMATTSHRLKGVKNVWHDTHVNVLDLQQVVELKGVVFEALVTKSAITGLLGAPKPSGTSTSDEMVAVIAKIDPFGTRLSMDRETRAYQVLQQHGASDLAPRFLGHVHEGGRVMGFLLEKLEGRRHALPEDFDRCAAVLERLHELGFAHGDVKQNNFLVGEDDVKMVDFESFREDGYGRGRQSDMRKLRERLVDVVEKTDNVDESGSSGGSRDVKWWRRMSACCCPH